MSELANPEFWVGVGFCLVVVSLARPVFSKIKLFAKAEATSIRQQIDEAKQLRVEAENLYQTYEERTKNFEQEKNALIQEAEKQVIQLQKEADDKLSKKIDRKRQDVQSRIDSIEENTRRDLTNSMMTQVMGKTKSLLAEKSIRQSEKDMDKALNDVLSLLELSVKK